MVLTLKQDKEYNCAVYCVYFVLQLLGIQKGLQTLEMGLGSTETDGTSHEQIVRYFSYFDIHCFESYNTDIEHTTLPAIVNYQYDDDGHYGVILSIFKSNIIMYNPAIGKIEVVDKQWFKDNFYSNRYGKGWALTV
jgi:predicted double-glycine peptidase